MVTITRLRPSDAIDVDCTVIASLFRQHGAAIAEDMLMAQVQTLTEQITTIDKTAQATGQFMAADKARMLSGLSFEIGLTSLAQTLIAVAQAVDAGNTAALPALWDRVKRIGDRSLVLLWDLPQLRM